MMTVSSHTAIEVRDSWRSGVWVEVGVGRLVRVNWGVVEWGLGYVEWGEVE